jgi:hypothetical protein
MKTLSVRVKRRCVAASAALVVLMGLTTRPAAAQVLDQVPADSLAVLKIKNLQATSQKIAKFATDLGLAAMVPQLNDPLKAFEDKQQISQGLNTAGDLFVAFLNPPAGADAAQYRSFVMLVPVSDYKAFLTNFPNAQTDGDVTQVQKADQPEPAFIANWGSFAAISPSKDVVAKKPDTSLTLTAAGNKELASKDIAIYANFAEIRTVLQPKLAENRDKLISQADDVLNKNPNGAKMQRFVNSLLNQMLDAANSLLRDTQSATFGLALSDDGLATTSMAEFAPDSYVGTMVSSVKNTTDPLLAGLPANKYLFFGGFVLDPAWSTKYSSELIDPIMKDLQANNPDAQSISDYVAAMKQALGAIKGGAMGVLAPSAPLGQGALLQEAVVYNGDAQVIADSMRKAEAQSQTLMKSIGMADQMKMTITPSAKTVDGVSFDSIATTLTPDPNNPMAQQQAQMMNMMYGPGGMVMYAGAAGDHFLVTTGLDDAGISSLIASAKSGDAPLSALAGVKKVAGDLPTNRAAEFYIPLDQIATTGLTYAGMFGFKVPVQIPPNLPPIGETISTDGATVRADAFVPTTLIQSLVAAGMQAFMAMQGGGANGGGGGM